MMLTTMAMDCHLSSAMTSVLTTAGTAVSTAVVSMHRERTLLSHDLEIVRGAMSADFQVEGCLDC